MIKKKLTKRKGKKRPIKKKLIRRYNTGGMYQPMLPSSMMPIQNIVYEQTDPNYLDQYEQELDAADQKSRTWMQETMQQQAAQDAKTAQLAGTLGQLGQLDQVKKLGSKATDFAKDLFTKKPPVTEALPGVTTGAGDVGKNLLTETTQGAGKSFLGTGKGFAQTKVGGSLTGALKNPMLYTMGAQLIGGAISKKADDNDATTFTGKEKAGRMLSQAGQWASAGSMLGPLGTIAGGIGGAIFGAASGKKMAKQAQAREREVQKQRGRALVNMGMAQSEMKEYSGYDLGTGYAKMGGPRMYQFGGAVAPQAMMPPQQGMVPQQGMMPQQPMLNQQQGMPQYMQMMGGPRMYATGGEDTNSIAYKFEQYKKRQAEKKADREARIEATGKMYEGIYDREGRIAPYYDNQQELEKNIQSDTTAQDKKFKSMHAVSGMQDPSQGKTYNEAFAIARNYGLQDFEFKGKTYDTRYAEETPEQFKQSHIQGTPEYKARVKDMIKRRQLTNSITPNEGDINYTNSTEEGVRKSIYKDGGFEGTGAFGAAGYNQENPYGIALPTYDTSIYQEGYNPSSHSLSRIQDESYSDRNNRSQIHQQNRKAMLDYQRQVRQAGNKQNFQDFKGKVQKGVQDTKDTWKSMEGDPWAKAEYVVDRAEYLPVVGGAASILSGGMNVAEAGYQYAAGDKEKALANFVEGGTDLAFSAIGPGGKYMKQAINPVANMTKKALTEGFETQLAKNVTGAGIDYAKRHLITKPIKGQIKGPIKDTLKNIASPSNATPTQGVDDIGTTRQRNLAMNQNAEPPVVPMGAKLGGKRKLYKHGGKPLEGGVAKPLPGGAVKFEGRSHEQGGIMVDPMTEVEGGETMDKVNFGKGGKKDYFFSKYLKLGGRSFADRHEAMVKSGAAQTEIDALADMQEKTAGRKKMRLGGERKLYKNGGLNDIYTDQRNKVMSEEGFTQKGFDNLDVVRDLATNGEKSQYWDTRAEYLEGDGLRHLEDKMLIATVNDSIDNVQKYKDKEAMVRGSNFIDTDTQQLPSETTQMFDTQENFILPKGVKDISEITGENDAPEVVTVDANADNNIKDSSTKNNEEVIVSNDSSSSDSSNATSDKKFTGLYNNITPEMLKEYGEEMKDLSGYDDFDYKNRDHVMALQNALIGGGSGEFGKYLSGSEGDYINPDGSKSVNKVGVDGKLGTDTFEALKLFKEARDEDEIVPIDMDVEQYPEEEEEVEILDLKKDKETNVNMDFKKPFPWHKVSTGLAMGLQLLPAIAAMRAKPDYMSAPGTIPKTHLDRVRYSDARAANARDQRSMGRFIEQSGLGPGGIAAKMAAYGRSNEQEAKIDAQEARQNSQIANAEAGMNQKANMMNVKNRMYVDEFNTGARAATKDRKLSGLDNLTKSVAGINKDLLSYKGQKDLARSISGNTGVNQRFWEIEAAFRKANPNIKPGTAEYPNALTEFTNYQNQQSQQLTNEVTNQGENQDADNARFGGVKRYRRAGRKQLKRKKQVYG